ncbi:MAG TPA: NADH-quinone oxidoreductase subunit G [Mycobacteriales bacterium]|nr:NADH-quinone oxidoreductase subunit G [Mycobacteriales bacterium]
MSIAPEKTDLITLTIDGFEISVPKGTLIIRAAEQLGLQIPRFCDHPLLDPVGACRQCLVEVTDMGNGRGMPKPAASCTTTVMPGMVVKTQLSSGTAEKAQRGIMELLLINHPLDCPICDKGGECPLQNQAMSNGAAESRFRDTKRTYPKPIGISSQVLLDRERCVLCARCTRFSAQVSGDPFIELFERGALEQVAIYEDEPYESYFSGNVVQICPVGALTGASYRFRSRPFDLVSTPSVCEHCSVGCSQRTDWRRGKVLRRLAGDEPEVNEEWNCDKGRWAFSYVTQTDRITTPLVRGENGTLEPASWTDALERAAEGLREARDAGGVGVLPGGRLTYEDAYAYGKFARVALGTNDIDARVRPHSAEELDFLAAFVAGSTPESGGVTFADVEHAPATLLVGLEPEEEAPVLFLRLRKAFRKHGSAIFGIAPFATAGLTKAGGTLLQSAPGVEPEVLAALADSAAEVEVAAKALRAEGSVILVGERLASVPGGLTQLARLATATGARVAWVPRRAGDRGAVEAGALPTLLPGGGLVSDAASRTQLETAWGATLSAAPGRDTNGILTAARDGELAALLIGGVDLDDLPDPVLATEALAAAGFVVSLELRHSSVTEHADVVFPVAPTLNKEGSYLNWEGRLRPFGEAIGAAGLQSDARVLDTIAAELDVVLGVSTPAAVRAELARLAGMPAAPKSAGTFAAFAYPPAEIPTPEPGQAVLATWHHLLDNGSLQDGEQHLAGTARRAHAVISAGTAAEIGAVQGRDVSVSTERGSITLPLIIGELPDRVVWLPTNSAGSAVRRTLGVDAGAVVTVRAIGGTL